MLRGERCTRPADHNDTPTAAAFAAGLRPGNQTHITAAGKVFTDVDMALAREQTRDAEAAPKPE